jgi:hypothetical protein
MLHSNVPRGLIPRRSSGEAAMKKRTKKLVLAKETVRDLGTSDRLKEVPGGVPTNYFTCGVSCYYFETCLC